MADYRILSDGTIDLCSEEVVDLTQPILPFNSKRPSEESSSTEEDSWDDGSSPPPQKKSRTDRFWYFVWKVENKAPVCFQFDTRGHDHAYLEWLLVALRKLSAEGEDEDHNIGSEATWAFVAHISGEDDNPTCTHPPTGTSAKYAQPYIRYFDEHFGEDSDEAPLHVWVPVRWELLSMGSMVGRMFFYDIFY